MIRISLFFLLILFVSCKDQKSIFHKKITVDKFYNLLDTTKMLSDHTELTLVFNPDGIELKAFVTEDKIKAAIFQHDTTIYRDPCIEIFLDPGADGLDYYEFEINAAGYGWALNLKSNDPPINAPENMSPWQINRNYEAIVSGSLNNDSDIDSMWTAIMKADYNSFSEGKPKKGAVWAYNFMRIDYDESNNPTYWVAKPTGRKMIHYPMTWPTITF